MKNKLFDCIEFDEGNSRILSKNTDVNILYTDSLFEDNWEFGKYVLRKVVEIVNEHLGNPDSLFGPDGHLDLYLLDEPHTSQEDREEILESVYNYFNKN